MAGNGLGRGHPLDPSTMIGAQVSSEQMEKILSYIDIGKKEGANLLTGGARGHHAGELAQGYYDLARPGFSSRGERRRDCLDAKEHR